MAPWKKTNRYLLKRTKGQLHVDIITYDEAGRRWWIERGPKVSAPASPPWQYCRSDQRFWTKATFTAFIEFNRNRLAVKLWTPVYALERSSSMGFWHQRAENQGLPSPPPSRRSCQGSWAWSCPSPGRTAQDTLPSCWPRRLGWCRCSPYWCNRPCAAPQTAASCHILTYKLNWLALKMKHLWHLENAWMLWELAKSWFKKGQNVWRRRQPLVFSFMLVPCR